VLVFDRDRTVFFAVEPLTLLRPLLVLCVCSLFVYPSVCVRPYACGLSIVELEACKLLPGRVLFEAGLELCLVLERERRRDPCRFIGAGCTSL
jgi:hypothetical protein